MFALSFSLIGCEPTEAPTNNLESEPALESESGALATQDLADLSIQEILDMSYLDELKAEATYEYVMDRFGTIRPFSNIVNAEVRHSQAIYALYDDFGLTAPTFDGIADPGFESISAACNAAVTAEIENIALYDELMPMITDERILTVFKSLQSASRDKHLPAFERCS